MSFFFNDAKKEAPAKKAAPKRRGHIPIASLQKMGCQVCPRNEAEMRSPKMRPEGPESPLIYFLGSSPSPEDDHEDLHWVDKPMSLLFKMFGRRFSDAQMRSNYITQCLGEDDVAATECCRPRIIKDIEESKPLVIVGVGDQVLRWATKLPSNKAQATTHRGTMFLVKIGSHICYYFPLIYPNWAFKEYGKSEWETATEHDVAFIIDAVSGGLLQPAEELWLGEKYDEGIEIITGTEPGDMQRLERALEEIAQEVDSALDVESTGLRVRMQKNPLLLTAAVGTFKRTVAFAIHHPEGWGTDAQIRAVERLFGRFLQESGNKIAHNLSMEMEWLSYWYGEEILRRTQWEDTMAQAYVLDERKGTKALGVQTVIHFGFDLKEQSKVDPSIPEWWLKFDLRDILRYNGMDTKWTHALYHRLKPKVTANPRYQGEYDRLNRTASTLVIMENLGMPVDMRYAEKMRVALDDEVMKLEAKIRRLPEIQKYSKRFGTFSITNNDHVLNLMRDVCERQEVEVIDKRSGKRTGWSTGEENLSLIPAKEVPSAAMILEHRGMEKLLSTYIRPVVNREIVCVDGLIRSKYGAMVAETGRLNSEDPNIQNWPKRTAIQKKVRGIIAALLDHEWMLACDYGQIEFRVVGMASEDENLVRACWTGYDVHKYWAERMVKLYPPIIDWIVDTFGVDWDEKGLKTLRQESKNKWVFPSFFGASIRSRAASLQLPDGIAEELDAELWDEFSGVKRWQEKLLASYAKKGYVETLDGRRRRGALSLNQIINHPIQGTALSIVCAGMNALSERALIEGRLDRHPRFNGHDDLSFFMPDSAVEENLEVIAYEMCKPRFDFINVPLIVEASIGPRWNELEEIKVFRSNEIFNQPNPYAEA